MQIFIPDIGTQLQLIQSWAFVIHLERRNAPLLLASGLSKFITLGSVPGYDEDSRKQREGQIQTTGDGWYSHHPVSFRGRCMSKQSHAHYFSLETTALELIALPKGAVLTVDRIYIRRGMSAYSSISFRIAKGTMSTIAHATGTEPFASKKVVRFWAKLADVNTMQAIALSEWEAK